MFYKLSRRETLISGATIASIPAVGGLTLSDTALAQTASAGSQVSSTAQIDAATGAVDGSSTSARTP